MEAKKRRKQSLIIVVAVVLVLGMCVGEWILIRRLTASPLRKALPSTAREIHEWSWSEGGLLGQDYHYRLKAKITEQEFLEYVDSLEMTPHTSAREYSPGFVFTWFSGEPKWWNPSSDRYGTYVYDSGGQWTYAKWENGYIYVVSYNI